MATQQEKYGAVQLGHWVRRQKMLEEAYANAEKEKEDTQAAVWAVETEIIKKVKGKRKGRQ